MKISLQNIIPVPLKERIEKQIGDVWQKNIEFDSNAFVKINAPSGTGKTTLMNVMYGLRTDYLGNVLYNDKNIKFFSKDELANIRQQKLSVVFQDLKLFSQLTAKENIDVKRTMQQPFYEESKISEMAEILGITNILHQKIEHCSYGEQQRVAIIRALIQPFGLLLMDEPFSHLDEANTKKAAGLIADECKKRNAGFVLTDLDQDNNFEYNKVLKL